MSRWGRQLSCALIAIAWLGGCVDIISVRQVPARYEAVSGSQPGWSITERIRVGLPEGKTSPLKPESIWHKVGHIEQGDVFHTTDQNVWVVASNQSEADIVVKDGCVVGFFLLVERTFAPAAKPFPIQTVAR